MNMFSHFLFTDMNIYLTYTHAHTHTLFLKDIHEFDNKPVLY